MSAAVGWGALSGVLATLVMDASAGFLKKAGITVGLDPPLLGRWIRSIARMHPVQADIRAVPSEPGEMPVAFTAHYLIGATFGVLFSLVAHDLSGGAARFGGGVVFGLATNAAPWFLMFPAMGFGFFGTRAPERKLFLTSALNHAMFGVGLGLFAQVFPL